MKPSRRFIFSALVLEMVIIGVLIVVTGCKPTPTSTPSPLATPTPNTSQLPTPQAEAEGRLVVLDELESEEETNTMSLPEILGTIATGVVGGIIAFLFERFKWFQDLKADAKFWVVGALSLGLPLAATALLQFVPAQAWGTLEPYWQALAAGGVIWLGSQLTHKFVNKGAK